MSNPSGMRALRSAVAAGRFLFMIFMMTQCQEEIGKRMCLKNRDLEVFPLDKSGFGYRAKRQGLYRGSRLEVSFPGN
jgi:hypothetical protein